MSPTEAMLAMRSATAGVAPAFDAGAFGGGVAGVDDRQAAVGRFDHAVMGDVAADQHVAAGGGCGGDA